MAFVLIVPKTIYDLNFFTKTKQIFICNFFVVIEPFVHIVIIFSHVSLNLRQLVENIYNCLSSKAWGFLDITC